MRLRSIINMVRKNALNLSDEQVDDPIIENVADNAWNVAMLSDKEWTALPRHWRAIRTTFWLYIEVQNGGLHQFLWNDDGLTVNATIEDLDYIGAGPFQKILCRAKHIYDSEGYPNRRGTSQNSWDQFTRGYQSGEMETLDHEFYALHDSRSLPDYITSFVRLHRKLFQSPT